MRFVKLVAISAFVTACTQGSPTESPKTSTETQDILAIGSCECDSIVPVFWDHNNANQTPQWVTNANNVALNNMMVIVTPINDPTDTEFYAWGIANGSQVGWLYRVPKSEYVEFQTKVAQNFNPIVAQDPSAKRFWGIGGGIIGIGPGNPGPIGFPPNYVRRLTRTAGSMVDSLRATLDADVQTAGK